MTATPFPDGVQDQDVFFHDDKVCVYHASINTWECGTFSDPPTTGDHVIFDGDKVYVYHSEIDTYECRTQKLN